VFAKACELGLEGIVSKRARSLYRSLLLCARGRARQTMYDFRQSTVPGCRTPHLWLRDGRSLYDALGSDFHC
jgi:hypothetical protein